VQEREVVGKLREGAIVLLHDGHDLFTDSARPEDTIAILPGIIKAAREKGLSFMKVSELLHLPVYKGPFEERSNGAMAGSMAEV
jgi:peptidoglycan/xylan/chitin deacetylase (PgdA/CDA1 family)